MHVYRKRISDEFVDWVGTHHLHTEVEEQLRNDCGDARGEAYRQDSKDGAIEAARRPQFPCQNSADGDVRGTKYTAPEYDE